MSTFKEQLKNLLTEERIEKVRVTGDVKHCMGNFNVKIGEIDFREKNFTGPTTSYTIINSPFNRDLNLHNVKDVTDKIRYVIEMISGCAKFNILPVSYIYDLPSWVRGVTEYILFGKDRGHSSYYISHIDLKFPISVWSRVVEILDETNCRGSQTIRQIRNNIVKQIDNGMLKTFSILDVTTKDMIDEFKNITINVEVSAESLENHKQEIININNKKNEWSAYRYGELELQSLLVKDAEPALDLDDLYNTVSSLDVFLAKHVFLSGFQSVLDKHANHECDMLFLHYGARLLQEKEAAKDISVRYKLFEKTESIKNRIKMSRLIYSKRIKTTDMKNLARMWETVAACQKWEVLVTRLDTIKNRIREFGRDGSVKNITDISPVAPRAALRWFDMIYDLKKELSWGSDVASLTTMVINHALEMLDIGDDGDPMDNEIVKSLLGATTGRAAREKKFYSVLHKNITKKYENDKPARESKEKKLTALREYLYNNGWTKKTFDVIDRKRENAYLVTTVDLFTGRGFQLGHKVAGAEFTDKNTFLQFPNDNIFNSAHDITEGYWIEYGSWVTDMMEQNPDTDIDAFEDTLKFCEIMEDRLI